MSKVPYLLLRFPAANISCTPPALMRDLLEGLLYASDPVIPSVARGSSGEAASTLRRNIDGSEG